MERKTKFTLILTIIFCLCACLIYPLQLYAQEGDNASEPVEEVVTEESVEEVVEDAPTEPVIEETVEVVQDEPKEETPVEQPKDENPAPAADTNPEVNNEPVVTNDNQDKVEEVQNVESAPATDATDPKEVVEGNETKTDEVLTDEVKTDEVKTDEVNVDNEVKDPELTETAPVPELNSVPLVYSVDCATPTVSVARSGSNIVMNVNAGESMPLAWFTANLSYDSAVFAISSVDTYGLSKDVTGNTVVAYAGANVNYSSGSPIMTVTFSVVGTIKGGKTYTFGATFDDDAGFFDGDDYPDYSWKNASISGTFSEGEHEHEFTHHALEPATCEGSGIKEYYYCTECGKYYTSQAATTEINSNDLAIAPLGHNYEVSEWTWAIDYSSATAKFVCSRNSDHVQTVTDSNPSLIHTDATCEDNEHFKYTANVTFDNKPYSKVVEFDGDDALGHNWNAPVWNWAENYSTASAKFVCSRNASHEQVVNATISTQTVNPGCETPGKTTYTATLTFNNTPYRDVKEVNIPATNHNYLFDHWVWATDYSSATAVFVCEHNNQHTHSEIDTNIDTTSTPSTCEGNSSVTYTANISYGGKDYSDSQTVYGQDALGHSYKLDHWEWAENYSSAKAVFICERNSHHIRKVDATMGVVTVNPKCGVKGSTTYTASVSFENNDYSDQKVVEIDALTHNWGNPVWSWSDDHKATATFTCANDTNKDHVQVIPATMSQRDVPATCTDPSKSYFTGKVTFNNVEYTSDELEVETGPATGHNYQFTRFIWDMTKPSAQALFTCEHNAEHTFTVDATVSTLLVTAPTETAAGLYLYKAEVVYEGSPYRTEFEVPAYLLTFDLDGGTLNGKDTYTITAGEGMVITIPGGPVKSGFNFKYWEGSKYYPGDKYTVSANHKLKAIFEKQSDSSDSSSSSNSSSTSNSTNTRKPVNTGSDRLITAAAIGLVVAAVLKKKLNKK